MLGYRFSRLSVWMDDGEGSGDSSGVRRSVHTAIILPLSASLRRTNESAFRRSESRLLYRISRFSTALCDTYVPTYVDSAPMRNSVTSFLKENQRARNRISLRLSCIFLGCETIFLSLEKRLESHASTTETYVGTFWKQRLRRIPENSD